MIQTKQQEIQYLDYKNQQMINYCKHKQIISFAIKLRMYFYQSTKYTDLSEPYFYEPHEKCFRLINYAFTRNLETFCKTHKKVLPQIDDLIKVRLKKQQQSFVDNNLKKIFQQNVTKLIKQSLDRNSHVQSIMNTFYFEYYQKNSQQSKTNQINKQSIQSTEKTVRRFLLAQYKCRSKNVVNNSTISQNQKKKKNYQRNISRKNTSDLAIQGDLDAVLDKKIMLSKRNFTLQKNLQRKYSLHSQIVQQNQESFQNFSFSANKHKIYRIENQGYIVKQQPEKDLISQTFRPFCGLNTKQIFQKKPIPHINNSQSTMSDFKISFASRAIMRGKITFKKTQNLQTFANTFYDHSTIQSAKEELQVNTIMKQNIFKISSDLAIKTLQPQGYRGKNRGRYRNLHEIK